MKHLLIVCVFAALGACASTSEPIVRVPMDVSSGRPVVNLTINGEGPFPFVLDTGAGAFVIQPSTFEQLGLATSGETTISSPGGAPVPVSTVMLEDVAIAGNSFGQVDALFFENGSMVSSLGVGVFGPTFLRGFGRTYLNFVDYELEVGGSFITPEDGNWLAFGESAPLLDVTLELGELEIPARLDSGNPSIVTFPQEYAAQLPLDSEVETVGQARTVDRAFDILGARMQQTIKMGNAEIPLENVRFFDRDVSNVGMGAMHGLALEIDWENERFAITGVAEPKLPRRRMRRTNQNPPSH